MKQNFFKIKESLEPDTVFLHPLLKKSEQSMEKSTKGIDSDQF